MTRVDVLVPDGDGGDRAILHQRRLRADPGLKKLVFIIAILGAYYAYERFLIPDFPANNAPQVSAQSSQPSARSSPASVQWHSGQQVRGIGTATRILSDDNDGSRHQRFILRLASGQTVLIAHNIDLAPRISSLSTGDTESLSVL